MKSILFLLMAMIVVFCIVTPAKATLILKGTDTVGNRLIYDDDYDITWYDFSNGQDTYDNQIAWADSLTVNLGGNIYTDWRLPTLSDPILRFDDTGSEFGHLYYTELGNTVIGGLVNKGDFVDLQESSYWYDTNNASSFEWKFSTFNGEQITSLKTNSLLAMAVRSGDVGAEAVPEPATIALLGIGLAGLAGGVVRQRFRQKVKDRG